MSLRHKCCELKEIMITKEQGIEVRGASAGLQGQNSSAVFGKVEVLKHVEGLESKRSSESARQ